MAFSWKEAKKRALRKAKTRLRIFQKTGVANTDVGLSLKRRIERMEKK